MVERRKKQPSQGNSFIDDFVDWMGTKEAMASNEVLDLVWTILEKVDVDANGRKLIWEDGQRLSIVESVDRIHADQLSLQRELIDTHLVGWLEMGFSPDHYSEAQLDDLDRLTEKWVADHERQVDAAQKRRRTRHS